MDLAQQVPLEMVDKIIMMRQSPEHCKLINNHELEYESRWDNGAIKYRVFKNAQGEVHKIGGAAVIGWDSEGRKVSEQWFKKGKVSRCGREEPARTLWDKKGLVYNQAWFEAGRLIQSTNTHRGNQVWSTDFECWMDDVVGIDEEDRRAAVRMEDGRLFDVPYSWLHCIE